LAESSLRFAKRKYGNVSFIVIGLCTRFKVTRLRLWRSFMEKGCWKMFQAGSGELNFGVQSAFV